MPDTSSLQIENPCLGRIVFGQRPVSHLHLGHLVGCIAPIIALQPKYEMVILIADGLPGTAHSVDLDALYEVASSWLAAGLSPNESLLARLSAIPEIEVLASLLSPFVVHNLTVPTEIYLEACTLIALQATHAPAHSSQRAAQILAASIAHNFNSQTHARLAEPAFLALPEEHLPGLDGDRQHVEAGNAILLGENEETTLEHLVGLHDTKKSREAMLGILKRLPGQPAISGRVPTSPDELRRHTASQINDALHSLRVKRMKWLAAPAELNSILQFGSLRARMVAADTLAAVQRAISSA